MASDARKKSMPGFLRDRRNPAVNYLATRKAKEILLNLILFDENVVKEYSLVKLEFIEGRISLILLIMTEFGK